MHRALSILVVATSGLVTAVPVAAQIGPYDLHRIFLHDGEALPSYGDYAVVGDRVVFTLPIGGMTDVPQLQLMSLPATEVDLDRSGRYSESLRAARYAATRGESDYLAMTDQVSYALEQLRAVEDPLKRLQLAEQARTRLLSWSADHFSYRAADIQELAGLFDEVIADLRVAAGQDRFAFDLTTGPAGRVFEPMLDVPTRSRSVDLAIAAARRADIAEERIAILRSTAALLESARDSALPMVEKELAAEIAAEAGYALLADDLIGRAEQAVVDGNANAVDRLRIELATGDAGLGHRRPLRVRQLRASLDAYRDRALAHRLALDRFEMRRTDRLAYERRIRPVTSAFDGLRPILEAVRDQQRVPFATLEHTIGRLARLTSQFAGVDVPEDLADVHATLASALTMARQATDGWRRAVITERLAEAGQASAAAAGSLLLAGRARELLIERLFPPKVR